MRLRNARMNAMHLAGQVHVCFGTPTHTTALGIMNEVGVCGGVGGRRTGYEDGRNPPG